MRRLAVVALALFALLAACDRHRPDVVTRVETEVPTLDPAIFETQDPAPLPPRPVSFVDLFRAWEEVTGLYGVCRVKLGEIKTALEEWAKPPATCEDERAGC